MTEAKSPRKWWQMSIPDIIVIAVLAAVSRVINVIGIMIPFPTPIGDWYFIMQFSFLVCVTCAIVRKPFTIIMFTIIQMLVNLLFFGGSPIWAMQNLGMGIITEVVALAIWYSTSHYMDNWKNVLIIALTLGIANFFTGFVIVMGIIYGMAFPLEMYEIAVLGFLIAGPIMALLGFRTGTAIRPLIGK